MAIVKVKFRKSTRKNGSGSIVYQLYHKGRMRQLSSGIRLKERQWNDSEERPDEGSENDHKKEWLRRWRIRIECDVLRFRQIIETFDARGKSYTLGDVIRAFRNPKSETQIFAFIKKLIDGLEQHRKHGTARNFRSAMNSFREFLGVDDLPFSLITSNLMTDYEQWLLDKGVRRNSSSFYIRTLRSAYNKAVKQGVAKQNSPFQAVYTGVDRTRKRALDEKLIVELMKMKLKTEALRQSRDFFIFSYCTRGMAFVDTANLRKTNISGGVISYVRRKTGQQLSIRIEPCVQNIIDHYQQSTNGSPYVFPIITATDPKKAYRQYLAKLGYYNHQLKTLSRMLGKDLPITSYWARHSWATAARDKHIPLSIISAGMGHTSEKTTQIYLDSLDNSVIDQANSDILSPLNELIIPSE